MFSGAEAGVWRRYVAEISQYCVLIFCACRVQMGLAIRESWLRGLRTDC